MDRPAVAQSVDRRVAVSPAQARSLLAAVRGLSERGQHLEAFYACLYYAALRPSEAVLLCGSALYLPKKRWGRTIQDSAYSAVWAEARQKALTPTQCRSPHGSRRRPVRRLHHRGAESEPGPGVEGGVGSEPAA